LANTIGYLAEAAWHHPDLSVGYAQVTVKLRTHRANASLGTTWRLRVRSKKWFCGNRAKDRRWGIPQELGALN